MTKKRKEFLKTFSEIQKMVPFGSIEYYRIQQGKEAIKATFKVVDCINEDRVKDIENIMREFAVRIESLKNQHSNKFYESGGIISKPKDAYIYNSEYIIPKITIPTTKTPPKKSHKERLLTDEQIIKYAKDLPNEGIWNWKRCKLLLNNYEHGNGYNLTGVLLSDGCFYTHGQLYQKGEFKIIDENPLKF